MKTSLSISALILLVAGLLQWPKAERLATARARHDQLAMDYRTATHPPDGATADGSRARTKGPVRRGSEADPGAEHAVFKKLQSFSADQWAIWNAGGQPGPDLKRRELELIQQMGQLNVTQLENLFADLNESADFGNALFGLVLTFAKEYPAKTLALIEGLPISTVKKLPAPSIEYALKGVLRDDPAAAIAWVRKNANLHAEIGMEPGPGEIVIGSIAPQDPKLAIQLMGEFTVHPARSAEIIARGAGSPADRTAVLAAMRGYLATVDDPEKKSQISMGTIGALTGKALGDGYESAAKWLESAQFTAEETAAFEHSLWYGNTKDDTGKWIGWVAEHLPPGRAAERIDSLVSRWAEDDYVAAGSWINSTADGPAKMAAVRGYAQALAPYEPASAAQWALSLPDDESRMELMGKIHAEWQKVDPPAAASFARDQGLK